MEVQHIEPTVTELEISEEEYTPVLSSGMITSREALTRINKKLMPTGKQVTSNMFYHYVHQQKVKHVKLGTHYFFHPRDIDSLQLPEKLLIPIEPKQVHSLEDLQELSETYGTLVDIDGMIQILKEKTGHDYTPGAIKQRLHRKTIWYAAYTGEKRKHYWFPAKQIDFMNLQPERAERKKRENQKAFQERLAAQK